MSSYEPTYDELKPRKLRSGFEYMDTITGRSKGASKWFHVRIIQLLDLRWAFSGIKRILRDEVENKPWEMNATDYGPEE